MNKNNIITVRLSDEEFDLIKNYKINRNLRTDSEVVRDAIKKFFYDKDQIESDIKHYEHLIVQKKKELMIIEKEEESTNKKEEEEISKNISQMKAAEETKNIEELANPIFKPIYKKYNSQTEFTEKDKEKIIKDFIKESREKLEEVEDGLKKKVEEKVINLINKLMFPIELKDIVKHIEI